MLTHTGTLWQYLGNFLMYTLLTVGAIYGVFWYTRKANAGTAATATAADATKEPLTLESALALEPSKNLYVIRTGAERFLLSVTPEGTQLLSQLESVPAPVVEASVVIDPPAPVEPKVDLPWYATEPPRMMKPPTIRRQGFGERFVQSIQWLVATRMR